MLHPLRMLTAPFIITNEHHLKHVTFLVSCSRTVQTPGIISLRDRRLDRSERRAFTRDFLVTVVLVPAVTSTRLLAVSICLRSCNLHVLSNDLHWSAARG